MSHSLSRRRAISVAISLTALTLPACKESTSSTRANSDDDTSRLHMAIVGPANAPTVVFSAPSTSENLIWCETAYPVDCKPDAPGYGVATKLGTRGDLKFFAAASLAPRLKHMLPLSALALDASNNVIESTRLLAREAGAPSIDSALALIKADDLRASVTYLASPELAGRKPQSDGSKKAQQFIIASFEASGLQPAVNGKWLQPFTLIVNGSQSSGENVIGMLPGVDPVLKNEVVIIGGHMDHLGSCVGLKSRRSGICLGADDNASGAAAVMAAAKVLGAVKSTIRRTILFMAFDSEERGLLGSTYYANSPLFPIANTVYMINLDMIGYVSAAKMLHGLDAESSRSVGQLLQAIAKKYEPAIPAIPMTGRANGGSDHKPFGKRGVPHVFFHTGTEVSPYHDPDDTPEKLDYDGIANTAKITAELAYNVAQNPTRPESTMTLSVVKGTPTSLADEVLAEPFADHGVTEETKAEIRAWMERHR